MDRSISRTEIIQNVIFQMLFQQEEKFKTTVIPITDIDSSHDKEYQSLFEDKGTRKAQEVLPYVNAEYQRWLRNSDLQDDDWASLCRSTAIVSIGGADGSELIALMNALGCLNGILVEISASAAALARARGINVVIEDDVMNARPKVVSQLHEWQRQGKISTVLISCQSVLHELPSRSLTFTKEAFCQGYLASLMKLGLRVMFYTREPCPPPNWTRVTDAIALRLFGLQKDDVAVLASYIAQKLNIQFSVDSTEHISNDDTRIILPVVLAQEILFKMLYCKNITHFQYEMGEQITSFQPQNWLVSLKNMNMCTKIHYLTTRHFSDLYNQEKSFLGEPVAINAHNGAPLEMPQCFVQLFASSVMPSAI